MSGWFLGLDTSNYRTSVAAYSTDAVMFHERRLLPVAMGQTGLRQSDAVFSHVRQIPGLLETLLAKLDGPVLGVTVSDRPRDAEGSYMPCFAVGETVARSLAAAYRVPLYRISHQTGHVLAALFSADVLNWRDRPFLAFHVSGGTTEAVLVTPDRERVLRADCVAGSLDLKAGQAIDRVGVMLGMGFPAGQELAELALQSSRSFRYRPYLKDGSCSLSGIENQAKQMLDKGEAPCDIARYTIGAVGAALDGMTGYLLPKYGGPPLIYAGGVMANETLRTLLGDKYHARFASPELSGDNACGAAIGGAILAGQL